MSYLAEVIADNSGQWTSNLLRFPTKQAAENYAADLAYRWTAVRQWRVRRDRTRRFFLVCDACSYHRTGRRGFESLSGALAAARRHCRGSHDVRHLDATGPVRFYCATDLDLRTPVEELAPELAATLGTRGRKPPRLIGGGWYNVEDMPRPS